MKIGCTLLLESFKGDVDQFYNGSRSQNLDLGSWTPGAKQTRPWAPVLFASSECTNSFTIWYSAMAAIFTESILRMVIWNKTITSLIYNFGKEWWEFTLFYKTSQSFPLFSNWWLGQPNHVAGAAILLQCQARMSGLVQYFVLQYFVLVFCLALFCLNFCDNS